MSAIAQWIWSLRIPGNNTRGVLSWIWVALSLLLILFAPTQLFLGVPFWSAAPDGVLQAVVIGATYLILVVILAMSSGKESGIRLVPAAFAAASCFGILALAVKSRPGLIESPQMFMYAVGAAAVLAIFPFFGMRSGRLLASLVLVAGVAGAVLPGVRAELAGVKSANVVTQRKLLALKTYSKLLGPITNHRGGAIEPYGKSFLLVTSDGDFYKLDWNENDALVAERLALTLPRDPSAPGGTEKMIGPQVMVDHKVVDLTLDTASSPAKVLVSHERWNYEKKCYTVIVSEASLTGALHGQPSASWKTVYETKPCLPKFIDYLESGGRLTWLGDKLLLTTGDLGLAGSVDPPHAQNDDTDWGKVLLIDRAGNREIFSKGHRNPQGLFVDPDQNVWTTEHGPKGGDEINRVEKGLNYGWPFATYGTNYARYFWSMAPTALNHGGYSEPIFAFVPSVGISNLIRVKSKLFPEWNGDLLVGSLVKQTLFRVRVRDDKVRLVEPISIGLRIRDLSEGEDGRFVLWTDEGSLVTLSPGPSQPAGEVVFARCRMCHDVKSASEQLAPSLQSIVGANVARDGDFEYSPALRNLGGNWTEDRLDKFLADPDAYAPGSAMGPGQVDDPEERKVLIDFLKKY